MCVRERVCVRRCVCDGAPVYVCVFVCVCTRVYVCVCVSIVVGGCLASQQQGVFMAGSAKQVLFSSLLNVPATETVYHMDVSAKKVLFTLLLNFPAIGREMCHGDEPALTFVRDVTLRQQLQVKRAVWGLNSSVGSVLGSLSSLMQRRQFKPPLSASRIRTPDLPLSRRTTFQLGQPGGECRRIRQRRRKRRR